MLEFLADYAGPIGFVAGFIAGWLATWGWILRGRPATSHAKPVPKDENNARIWSVKVTNPKGWLIPRGVDSGIWATVYIEEANGSVLREFDGRWFASKPGFNRIHERKVRGRVQGRRTVNLTNGETNHIVVCHKLEGQSTAELYLDAPGWLEEQERHEQPLIGSGSYTVRIELNVSGGCKTAWYSLHNKDETLEAFRMEGPFKRPTLPA